MKKILNLRMIAIGVILLTASIGLVKAEMSNSSNENNQIEINGQWPVLDRSLVPSTPISAWEDDAILMISNQNPDRDITIIITSKVTGESVFTQSYNQAQTAYIVIPISWLDNGTYSLMIIGKPMGELEGELEKG